VVAEQAEPLQMCDFHRHA